MVNFTLYVTYHNFYKADMILYKVVLAYVYFSVSQAHLPHHLSSLWGEVFFSGLLDPPSRSRENDLPIQSSYHLKRDRQGRLTLCTILVYRTASMLPK